MKGMIHCCESPGKLVAVTFALLALILFTSPNCLMAASGEKKPAVHKTSHVDRTEARIKELFKTLKITPAQEELWKALAQVMRENAKDLDALIQARRAEKANKPMNAVEDLQSYSKIVEAHSEGLKKFIPAFEALYNSMSAEQKKNADAIFRASRHGKSKKR